MLESKSHSPVSSQFTSRFSWPAVRCCIRAEWGAIKRLATANGDDCSSLNAPLCFTMRAWQSKTWYVSTPEQKLKKPYRSCYRFMNPGFDISANGVWITFSVWMHKNSPKTLSHWGMTYHIREEQHKPLIKYNRLYLPTPSDVHLWPLHLSRANTHLVCLQWNLCEWGIHGQVYMAFHNNKCWS